jgi:hypothetical protein
MIEHQTTANPERKKKTKAEKLAEALTDGRVYLCTNCGHRNKTETCGQCRHTCVKCAADGRPVIVGGKQEADDPILKLRTTYNFERMREAALCDVMQKYFGIKIDPEKTTKKTIIARLDEEIEKRKTTGSRK